MEHIKFNGVRSDDLGLELIAPMSHISTSNDIETIEILGRDGALFVDNQRLKPVEQPFSFVLRPKTDVFSSIEPISNWLNVKGEQEFEKSWDPEFIYRASYLNTLQIEEVVRQFGKLQTHFLFYPIKFYKDSLRKQKVTNGQTIQNNGNVIAQPIWTFKGSGNLTLRINDRVIELKDIQNELTYDLQHKMVYKGSYTSQWHTIVSEQGTYEKPYLEIGSNRISWTGNFTVEVARYTGVKL